MKRTRTHNTSFRAGGLVLDMPVSANYLKAPEDWQMPLYIDNRPLITPHTDDQGRTSECVVYALHNILESFNWMWGNPPTQLDPHPTYVEAKRLDGTTYDGTTLHHGIQAARNRGLVSAMTEIRYVFGRTEIMWGVMTHRLILAGFKATRGWNRVRDGWIGDDDTPIGGHGAVICRAHRVDGVTVFNQWGRWGYELDGVWGYADMTWKQFEAQYFGGMVLYLPVAGHKQPFGT